MSQDNQKFKYGCRVSFTPLSFYHGQEGTVKDAEHCGSSGLRYVVQLDDGNIVERLYRNELVLHTEPLTPFQKAITNIIQREEDQRPFSKPDRE